MTRGSSVARVFLTATYDTLRSPAAVGGKVGALVAHLSDVAGTELLPVDAGLRESVPQLARYARLWQLFVATDTDVQAGDVVRSGSTDYPVVYAELWPWPDSMTFRRMVVEERAV